MTYAKDLNGEFLRDANGNRIEQELFENSPMDKTYDEVMETETPEMMAAWLKKRGISLPPHLEALLESRKKQP